LPEFLHDVHILQITIPYDGGFPTTDWKVARKEESKCTDDRSKSVWWTTKTVADTRRGERTRADKMDQRNRIHQWVGKDTKPLLLFDLIKEKDTYKQARK